MSRACVTFWESRACVSGWFSRPTLLEHLTYSLLVEQYRRDGEAVLV